MCKDCDNSDVRKQYNAFSRVYQVTRSIQHKMLSKSWKMLASEIPDKHFRKVVDLGCGVGSLLGMFGDAVLDYCGVDISEEMLQRTQEYAQTLNRPVKLVRADLVKLPLDAASFDLAFSNSVIHWLYTPQLDRIVTAFGEVRRILLEGGVFVGSVSGVGTARRILKVYERVMECAVQRSEAKQGLTSHNPIGSMELHEVVECLHKTGFRVLKAVNVYQPEAFESVLEYLKVVEAYGYEMFMRPVEKPCRRKVWQELEQQAIIEIGDDSYLHDQYVIYFLAVKKDD